MHMAKWMLIILCLWSVSAMAQYAGYKPLVNSEGFRREFTKTAQATQSIMCDFVQEKNLSMLEDKIVSTGKFWFKRDNKVRMEYFKPTYYLIVINGNNIKTKDSQKETKVSGKSFEQVNKMMIDCVQGTALDNKSFKSINLTVDKKDYSVTKMDMVEQSGDNTVISFLHKQMNVNIKDDVFAIQ